MATKQQKGLGLFAAAAGLFYLATRKGDGTSSGPSGFTGGTTGGTAGVAGFDPMQPTQPGKPGDPPTSSPTPTVGGLVGPGPGSDPGAGGVVSTIPIPGMLYRIKQGDTLLGVAGTAYNLGAGSDRLSASIAINDDAWNRANASYSETVLQEADWYGPERLSFAYPYQVINIPEAW